MIRPYFLNFLGFNLLFLSVQLGYVLSKSSSFILTIPLPTIVYTGLFFTLLVHFLLYFFLSILQTILLFGLMQYPLQQKSIKRWQFAIGCLSVFALLAGNRYFYPLSLFSQSFLPAVPKTYFLISMMCSLFILGILFLNTLVHSRKRYSLLAGLLVLLSIGFSIHTTGKHTPLNTENTQPNVILIGVDSLSPSRITRQETPTLAHFIEESVFFKETISPLAHTYPAWTTILTGLYPHHHHARYNLIPPDLIKSSQSIAWSLQKRHYQTIYATDDRRFNNIGNEFGFQTIIGPKIGASEVLLGTFNDFPLSNLIVNTPIGGILFPYNHMNRASHFTYYPQTFDKALQETLRSSNKDFPFFIAVHFTLPHWPYAWAESTPLEVKDEYDVQEREHLYVAALQKVDQQIAKLLDTLQQNGYLKNSLLILLSDHGEVLYVPGSRQTSAQKYLGMRANLFVDYLRRKTSTELEKSAGHGTDLLSPAQFHCLLALKVYQHNQLITQADTVNTRVALIDLAPTIQDFLGLSADIPLDGISLLKRMMNHDAKLPKRAFILESGMLPNQFLTREKARQLGQKYFTIDPQNGQLLLQKQELKALDALKLYGMIEGNWLFALYPDDAGYIPIILHLPDGKWTDELNSEFARSTPAVPMLKQLTLFYQRNWTLIQPKI